MGSDTPEEVSKKIGGLIGYSTGVSRVRNSYATGNVTGWRNIGGLVGELEKSNFSSPPRFPPAQISNSYATGNVSGNGSIGGLVGLQADDTEIINSHATGLVTGSYLNIGGLVGWGVSNGKVLHSYATGIVRGVGQTGGLVGYGNRALVESSYATGNVFTSDGDGVGGLMGVAVATISNSYATGNVSGFGSLIGGLVGAQQGGSNILNSYARGNVAGSANIVGGLVGQQREASNITNSYTTGNVSGFGRVIGGLVGAQEGGSRILNSYATGNVWGSLFNIGGLVGGQVEASSITNSYATGMVTVSTLNSVTSEGFNVGGLVGYENNGSISNSYSTGNVVGYDRVGSLVGKQNVNSSSIARSYAIGMVTGIVSANVGGLLGQRNTGGTITDSYWNTTTTGYSVGVGNVVSASGVTGLTTTEMQAIAAVTGPPALSFPSGLASCFRLTANKYPQLYTWDASLATPACTTTLLGGLNSTR